MSQDAQATASARAGRGPARGPSRLAAWLQLLRVPNLLTVPGDSLAGFMLAWSAQGAAPWGRAVAAAAASLLLYAAGLLLNDYFDLQEDRESRPSRPLPAGHVTPRAVFGVAALLLLVGLGAAEMADAAVWGVLLAAAVFGYDAGLKRVRLVGPLLMGTCRGLSLMLGAAAAGGANLQARGMLVGSAAIMLGLYIAGVTLIAAGETRAAALGPKRFLPAGVLAAGFTWLATFAAPQSRAGWIVCGVLALAAVGWAAASGLRLSGKPQPATVQKTVGTLVRNLLYIQAALAAVVFWPGAWIAAGLLLAWPAACVLARRFYAS